MDFKGGDVPLAPPHSVQKLGHSIVTEVTSLVRKVQIEILDQSGAILSTLSCLPEKGSTFVSWKPPPQSPSGQSYQAKISCFNEKEELMEPTQTIPLEAIAPLGKSVPPPKTPPPQKAKK
jgi:hypothetical protein